MSINRMTLFSSVALTTLAEPVFAYIGPGAGAGTIAVVLGILASIGMAILALLWYPAKRFLKSRKTRSNQSKPNDLN